MTRFRTRLLGACVTIAAAVLLPACATRPAATEREKLLAITDAADGDIDDPAALAGALSALSSRMYTDTVGLASEIGAATTSQAVREETLRMKIRASAFVDNMMLMTDPRRSFVYAWLVIEESLYHLEEGQGREIYGKFQGEAIENLKSARASLLDIGYRYFGKELIDRASDDIEEMAQRQLLRAEQDFADRMPFSEAMAISASRNKDIGPLLGIPMAPVSALQGAANTPVAIQDVADVATIMARVIQNIPERTRWQAELLLYEAEELPAVQSLRDDATRFSEAAQRIAKTVEALPDELRTTMAQLEEQQPELQKTITEARQAVADARQAIADAAQLVEATDQTAASVRLMLADIDEITSVTPSPDGQPRKSDIDKLTELAQALTELTADLRSLAGEAEGPLAKAQDLTDNSIDYAAANARQLIDAAAWRLAAVVVLAFLLAAAYRLMFRRKTS